MRAILRQMLARADRVGRDLRRVVGRILFIIGAAGKIEEGGWIPALPASAADS